MYKSTIALTALALTAFDRQAREAEPRLELKEEKVFLEYTASADEIVLVVEAESEEDLDGVQVRSPRGAPILELQAESGQRMALSGFTVESRETSYASLFGLYEPGLYDIRARTVDGREALGSALLSHELLPAPAVIQPHEGSTNVPPQLVVKWIPDSRAAGYRVSLEQNENDGLAVSLPPGSSSFRVPPRILAPDTDTQLEIAAIGLNGNVTLVEVTFRTRR
jgi:hypothetical protein